MTRALAEHPDRIIEATLLAACPHCAHAHGWFAAREPHRLKRILVTPGDPTTEALAVCMMTKLNAFLAADGARLFCASIRIDETPTNIVAFEGDATAFLPRSEVGRPWWTRADMSINDVNLLAPPPDRAVR